jgi:hypothetical protein
MVWGYLTYYGVGTLAFIDGNMNSQKYIQTCTLDDNIWPVVRLRIRKSLFFILFFNKSHIFSIGLKSGD